MSREEFEKIVEEEFPRAVPEKFHTLIKNVGFLIEDEPDEETRRENGLRDDETLLGLYRGISHVNRGEYYGVGATLPDTITLYQLPLEDEAEHILRSQKGQTEGKTWTSAPERTPDGLFGEAVRKAVRETIWHEVAHYFGYDEEQVQDREERGI